MLTLTLDGQLVDLPTDAAVALSYRSSDLRRLDTREASFSETFALPLTAQNARVLGTPHALSSQTGSPYRRLPAVLRANGVRLADDQSPTRNLAIACPALPTCSKALGEAELVLPDVVEQLEKVLADTGNTGLPLRLNMTGCPNGCTRPYAAELGIVGRTKRNYDIFVGGSPAGDRLARLLRADVPLPEVPELLRPLLDAFSHDAGTRSFGDWTVDQDWDHLQALLPPATSRRRPPRSDA